MVGSVGAGMNASLWAAYSQAGRNQSSQSVPTENTPGPSEETSSLKLSDKQLKRIGLKECETCRSRSYQDVSNDSGVSMKTPTHLSPEAANSAVRSHEGEHVSRETAKAESEGRHVVYQSVQIYTDICPECGRMYTSGGKTTTVTAADAPAPTYSTGEKGQLFHQVA